MVEQESEQEPEQETSQGSNIFSVEGLIMLSIGALLDIASIICVILILLFGIGLLLAKIVYIIGLIIVFSWVLFRSGAGEAMSVKDQTRQMRKTLLGFLKRQWKKLAGKLVPAVGDALPLWTWTIYSELKN